MKDYRTLIDSANSESGHSSPQHVGTRQRLGRTSVALGLVGGICLLPLSLWGQATGGSVNFCNDTSALLTNSGTGHLINGSEGVQAALYGAPAASTNFVQLGQAVLVGLPLPGLFAGGTRTIEATTAGGTMARFQVRAWGGGYSSFEEATIRGGVLLGESPIVELVTGAPGATPPVPPASLMANGLAGFALTSSPPVGPSILTQPVHQSVSLGGTAVLTVSAWGSLPVAYQWQCYGTNLDRETSSSLSLTNVSPAMAGHYSVIISNAAGTVTSATATLTLIQLNFFPVLTVFGRIGDNYRIEYSHEAEATNWATLANITLASNPYWVMDTNSPNSNKRFYRAIYLP